VNWCVSHEHWHIVCLSQELLAYGLSNSISSMFNSFVSAASLSRSIVQETSGGKTQVSARLSISLLFLFALFAIFISLTFSRFL